MNGDGTVVIAWDASPSAASRPVGYIVLRRVLGGSFAEIARTASLSYTDTPAPGTYEYMIRTYVSTWTSADSGIVSASPGP